MEQNRQEMEAALHLLQGEVIRAVYYEDIPWDAYAHLANEHYPAQQPFAAIHSVDFAVHLVTDRTSFAIGWGKFEAWAWALRVAQSSSPVPATRDPGNRMWDMTHSDYWRPFVGAGIVAADVYWADFDDQLRAFPQAMRIGVEGAACYLSAAEYADDAGTVAGAMSNILLTTDPGLAKTVLKIS